MDFGKVPNKGIIWVRIWEAVIKEEGRGRRDFFFNGGGGPKDLGPIRTQEGLRHFLNEKGIQDGLGVTNLRLAGLGPPWVRKKPKALVTLGDWLIIGTG